MKENTIKAGYRITVKSWENDADHYKTKVMEGLTKEEVDFYVDLCQMHRSKNARYIKDAEFGCWGNMYSPSDEEYEQYKEALFKLFTKHKDGPMGKQILEDCCGEESDEEITPEIFKDWVSDTLYDLFGSSEFYTRVFDSIKIELIPEPIAIQDATDQWVK